MEPEAKTPKKKSKWKLYLILILLSILVGGVLYGYFWAKGVSQAQSSAKNLIQEHEEFSATVNLIEVEYLRCEAFIAQQEGNFGEFEYCRGFIDWVNVNSL